MIRLIIRNKNKKKVRFKRKSKQEKQEKQEKQDKGIITKPLGGFMPFPPINCQKKKHIITSHGVPWIDLSICHNCIDIKTCDTRKEYLLKLKEERKEKQNEST